MKSPKKIIGKPTLINSDVKKATPEFKKPHVVPANSAIVPKLLANIKDPDFFKKLPKEGPFSFMVKNNPKLAEPESLLPPTGLDESHQPPVAFSATKTEKKIHPEAQDTPYPRETKILNKL